MVATKQKGKRAAWTSVDFVEVQDVMFVVTVFYTKRVTLLLIFAICTLYSSVNNGNFRSGRRCICWRQSSLYR
jgi:hypothetical protein